MKKEKDKSKPPVSAHRLNGERGAAMTHANHKGPFEASTTETLQAKASGRKNTKGFHPNSVTSVQPNHLSANQSVAFPNRLGFFLFSLLYLVAPKLFEAISFCYELHPWSIHQIKPFSHLRWVHDHVAAHGTLKDCANNL